jgi:hypothetical protein
MQVTSFTRRWLIAALAARAMAGPTKGVLIAVKGMETRDGINLVNPGAMHRRPALDTDLGGLVGVRAISPEGATIVYWPPLPPRGSPPVGTPFVVLESVIDGTRPISLQGQGAYLCGISYGARVIVIRSTSFVELGRKSLLALDLHSGLEVHDLTSYLRHFPLVQLETISVSASGTIVALGSREQIQVMEVLLGRSVFTASGRFPKLSPDGTHLAFIDQERLHIRSLADGSSRKLLARTRVAGVGGWSPDGRFLAAGAWTAPLAFDKRQIIVDTTAGEYGVIGTLGDGDYGDEFAWISLKLLSQ